MVILDTDHLTALERGGGSAEVLRQRLGRVPPEEVVTTIVNYEEQMRGWLAVAARASSVAQIQAAYERLSPTLRRLSASPYSRSTAALLRGC